MGHRDAFPSVGGTQVKPSAINVSLTAEDEAAIAAFEQGAGGLTAEVTAFEQGGIADPAAATAISPEAETLAPEGVTIGETGEVIPEAPVGEEVQPTIAEQFRESKIRAVLGLARTEQQREDRLVQFLGEDNVQRSKEGTLFFRFPGKEVFRKLDKDEVELVNDILDASGDIIDESVIVAAEVGGAALGAVAGGAVGGLPGIPVGAKVGFALGTVGGPFAATEVRDALAELAGIPEDKERERFLEDSLAAGFNLVIPGAFKVVGAAKKRISEMTAKGVPEHELLREGSKAFEEVGLELRDKGFIQNLTDSAGNDLGTPFSLHQLSPNSPQVSGLTTKIMGTEKTAGRFLSTITEQGENFRVTLDSMLREAGDLKGVGPLRKEALPAAVVNVADAARKAEGEAIGRFRFLAEQTHKGRKVVTTPRLNESLTEIMEEMGFTTRLVRGKAQIVPPDIDSFLANTDLNTAGAAKGMIEKVQKLAQGMKPTRGQIQGLTLQQYKEAVNEISKGFKTSAKAGGNFKRLYGQLGSALRESRNDAIRKGLPNEQARTAFGETMTRFRNVLDSQDSLARSLDDSISAEAFIKGTFTKGKDGLPQIKAARALLAEEHPDVWNNLTGQWVDGLIRKHSTDKVTGFNSKAMQKELDSFGPEFLNEVFRGTGTKPSDIRKMLTFGERIEKVDFSSLSRDEQRALVRDLGNVASGIFVRIVSGGYDLLNMAIGKNKEMATMLTSEGIEKFIGRGTRAQKQNKRRFFQHLLSVAEANGTIQRAAPVVGQAARSAARAAARPALTQEQ